MSYLTKKIDTNSLSVASHSLVNTSGLYYPLSYGNYFSITDGEKKYNIINMNKENFEYLSSIDWVLYEVLDSDNNSTNGYILFNEDLDSEWYLKSPYLYGTTINEKDLNISFGFNTKEKTTISKENIFDYILPLLEEKFTIKKELSFKFSLDFQKLSDFEQFEDSFNNVLFLELINPPYNFWSYSNFINLKLNTKDEDISLIPLIINLNSGEVFLRNQDLEKTIEKLENIYAFKAFEKKLKKLTTNGVQYLYEKLKDDNRF